MAREGFRVYPVDADTDPGVVFEGATKLPLCSANTTWAAVQRRVGFLKGVAHRAALLDR